MTTIQLSLNPFAAMSYSFSSQPERSPLHERVAVVGLVVLLHLSVFAGYLLQPEAPAVLVNEMSISFANMQMQQADVAPQPKPKPREPDPVPAEKPAVKEEVQPAKQEATPPSPVVLDAEPDYQAEYLHNPKPPYPTAAVRMGYQGLVLLDIEVLADGSVGGVQLLKSSGYKILDNAAMQAVKTWRFTPGRRLGQPVTAHATVPIRYIFEG
jgi:protein TonB